MKRDKRYHDWRNKVLERDDHKCVICKTSTKRLNAHHLIPKNFKEYEADVDNGLTLCVSHHTLGRFSAHKHPIWFSIWLEKNRPSLYWIAFQRLENEELNET
mgnify:CR=1 FL=1